MLKHLIIFAMLLFFLVILISCGEEERRRSSSSSDSNSSDVNENTDASITDNGEGGCTITDQPLQGSFDGRAWEFKQGSTSAFLSEGEKFFTHLYSETYEPCGWESPDWKKDSILVGIPKKVGTFIFDNHLNMTFLVEGYKNYVATTGKVRVDKITENTITAGLCTKYEAYFDEGKIFEVNGTFTASICK